MSLLDHYWTIKVSYDIMYLHAYPTICVYHQYIDAYQYHGVLVQISTCEYVSTCLNISYNMVHNVIHDDIRYHHIMHVHRCDDDAHNDDII